MVRAVVLVPTASTMFQTLEARFLAPDVKLLRIEAPRIARKRQAGQFVILRVHERGERIPITIAGSDAGRGDITIVVQGIGKTTKLLNALEAGDAIQDVVGPLGKPSEVELFGTACVVGGGVGAAIAYPTAVALKEAGNRVVSILGGRTRDLVILEDEIRRTSDALHVTTDDGSHGEKGLVTDTLRALIDGGEGIDYVLAIGPIPMMRAVGPRIAIERMASGTGNWRVVPSPNLVKSGLLSHIKLDQIAVRDGTINLIDARRSGMAEVGNVELVLSSPALGGPWRVRGTGISA